MRPNAVVLSLLDDLSNDVAKSLASCLDRYYANAEDYLEYRLQDEKDIKKLCGEKYLEQKKRVCLKELAEYCDTVVSLPFKFFLEKDDQKIFMKDCDVIFIDMPKVEFEKQLDRDKSLSAEEKRLNLMNFDTRRKVILSSGCQLLYTDDLSVDLLVDDIKSNLGSEK